MADYSGKKYQSEIMKPISERWKNVVFQYMNLQAILFSLLC